MGAVCSLWKYDSSVNASISFFTPCFSSLFSLFVKDDFPSGLSFKKSGESKSLCWYLQKEWWEWFALLLFPSQKTSDSHKIPKSKFPTLLSRYIHISLLMYFKYLSRCIIYNLANVFLISFQMYFIYCSRNISYISSDTFIYISLQMYFIYLSRYIYVFVQMYFIYLFQIHSFICPDVFHISFQIHSYCRSIQM